MSAVFPPPPPRSMCLPCDVMRSARRLVEMVVDFRATLNMFAWVGLVTRTTSPLTGRSLLHHAVASGDVDIVRCVAAAMVESAHRRDTMVGVVEEGSSAAVVRAGAARPVVCCPLQLVS